MAIDSSPQAATPESEDDINLPKSYRQSERMGNRTGLCFFEASSDEIAQMLAEGESASTHETNPELELEELRAVEVDTVDFDDY